MLRVSAAQFRMGSMLIRAVGLLGALISMGALPAEAGASAGWSGLASIVDFNPREYSIDIYIPAATNPMGCTLTGWYRLSTSAPNYQAIASLLMTQLAQNRPVRVFVSGCEADGATTLVAAKIT